MAVSVNFPQLLTTNADPKPKYEYQNGERTDRITGYSYRLIDVDNGEVLSVTIPMQRLLPAQSYVTVENAMATPYISGNRAVLSIKADDILPAED